MWLDEQMGETQELSGGGTRGQAPCPTTGPALSAQEHRVGAAKRSQIIADVHLDERRVSPNVSFGLPHRPVCPPRKAMQCLNLFSSFPPMRID